MKGREWGWGGGCTSVYSWLKLKRTELWVFPTHFLSGALFNQRGQVLRRFQRSIDTDKSFTRKSSRIGGKIFISVFQWLLFFFFRHLVWRQWNELTVLKYPPRMRCYMKRSLGPRCMKTLFRAELCSVIIKWRQRQRKSSWKASALQNPCACVCNGVRKRGEGKGGGGSSAVVRLLSAQIFLIQCLIKGAKAAFNVLFKPSAATPVILKEI